MITAQQNEPLIKETRETLRFQIGDKKYPCVNVTPQTEYDRPCIVLHISEYTTCQPSVDELGAYIRLLEKAREVLAEGGAG